MADQSSSSKKETIKYNVCMFSPPSNRSAAIEAYVKEKFDNKVPEDMDWGYIGGKPVMYLTRHEQPTHKERNEVEMKLRALGFYTYAGGYPDGTSTTVEPTHT